MPVYNGDPSFDIHLNDTGSNGRFRIWDDSGTPLQRLFELADDGAVTLYGPMARDNAVELDRYLGGPEILDLIQAGTSRMLLGYDSGEAYITSVKPAPLDPKPPLRLEGDPVRADAPDVPASPVTLMEFSRGGTIEGSLASGAGLGLIERFRLVSLGTAGVLGTDFVRLHASASGEGEVVRVARGGEDRLLSETEVGLVRVTTTKGDVELEDTLELRGEHVYLTTDRTDGTLAECRWSSGTMRLSVGLDLTDEAVQLVTPALASGEFTSFEVHSAKDIELRIDATQGASIPVFRVTINDGWSGGANPLYRILYDGRNEWNYPSPTTGPRTMMYLRRDVVSAGIWDGELALGDEAELRGRLDLRADTTNGRAGVLDLRDETDAEWYHWVTDAGLLRRGANAGDDPGTDQDSGFFVNDGPLAVVEKTASYTIQTEECGTCFTNKGSGGAITLTLPAASTVGLQVTVVTAEAEFITVTAAGTDELQVDTTRTLPGGSVVNATDDAGQVIRLVVLESGVWTATTMVGSWS